MFRDRELFDLVMNVVMDPYRSYIKESISEKYMRVSKFTHFISYQQEPKKLDLKNNVHHFWALVIALNEFVISNSQGYQEVMTSKKLVIENSSDYFGSSTFRESYYHYPNMTEKNKRIFMDRLNYNKKRLKDLIIFYHWFLATGHGVEK